MFDQLTIPQRFQSHTKNQYLTVRIDTWSDIESFFQGVSSEQWVFRGQDDSSFKLWTSLERFGKNSGESIEEVAIKKFKEDARNYSEVNEYNPQTTFEWLCIMQQYGISTRLLDFSFSPFVALFFAYNSLFNNNKDVGVWAVNKEWCKSTAIERIKKIKGYDNIDYNADLTGETAFNDIFLNNYQHGINFVYPVEIAKGRLKRLDKQQAVFLCQGNTDEGVEENLLFEDNDRCNFNSSQLRAERSKFIIKFVLSGYLRSAVLNELKTRKITFDVLFDSLDQYGYFIVRQLLIIDGMGIVEKSKINYVDSNRNMILDRLIKSGVVYDDPNVRVNPNLDQKEDLVREIAQDKFKQIWAILQQSRY